MNTDLCLFTFETAVLRQPGEYTGYETAKHYYGSQRNALKKEASLRGFDADRLADMIRKEVFKGKMVNYFNRIKNISGMIGSRLRFS